MCWTSSAQQAFQIRKHLQEEFIQCFLNFRSYEQALAIFQNSFTCDPENTPTNMQFGLLDLQESAEAKDIMTWTKLSTFLYKCLSPSTYPEIIWPTDRMASLFGSTHTCGKTFSIMNIIKSKMRSRLTDDHNHSSLHIATKSCEPMCQQMIAKKS